jgi:hypothetical protein
MTKNKMGIYSNLKSLDSKFSWSFMGFLIGILGIGYAIYIDQFKEEKPKVIFDILSNTQVLSVKENLNKLDIIYDNQNLKEQKENLILLTIRISNEGNEDIRESDYYSKAPFGFKINNGKIAENPIIIDASSKILKDNLALSYDTINNIILNKVPFNRDQYFTIKVLTICKENVLPSITPTGNITGINEIFPVRNSYINGQKKELSFFESLTFGSFAMHIARFFFYIFFIAIIGLLIGFPASKISTILENKKRKKKIEKFRDKTKIQLSDNIDLIFDFYKDQGEYRIKWLNRILGDKEKLKKHILRNENINLEDFILNDYPPEISQMRMESISQISETMNLISKLKDKKIIEKKGEDFIVNEKFKNELLEFNYFIDIQ